MQNLIKLAVGSIALLALLGCKQDNRDLQTILDTAAKNGEKNVSLSGTYNVEKPIVLTAKHNNLQINGSGKTYISGAKNVSELREDSKFWIGKVETDNVENIYVNGKRAILAESDYKYVYSPLKTDINHQGKEINPNTDGFVVRAEDIPELLKLSEEELKNIELDMYLVWYNMHVKLLGIKKNPDGKTVSVFVKNPSGASFYNWEKFPRFKIRNAKSELDTAGEFFFDKSTKTITYLPRNGETLANAKLVYPVVSQVLLIKGDEKEGFAKNIKLNSITFQYGGHFPDEKWKQAAQAQATVSGFVCVSNAENITIENTTVEHCNIYGIDFAEGVTNSTIKDSILFDCGSGGIRVGGQGRGNAGDTTYGNTIYNNIIYQYGRYNKAGVGICIFSSGNNIVDHNTIFDGYYSGMSIGWTWGFRPTETQNNRITNNRIFKIGHGVMDDMGGIYTLGNATGSVITGNEISEVRRHRYGGWGIYNDEGSHGFYIANNYVHDTHEDGYFQHYGTYNLIKNNIFVNSEVTQVGLGRKNYKDSYRFTRNIVVYTSPAGLFRQNDILAPETASFDNNIYWNTKGAKEVSFSGLTFEEWKKKGQDKNSFIIDPALKGTEFGNDNYKKIGFRPFSTKDAGVVGMMKSKLDKILANYVYPPILKMEPESPWDKEFDEDFTTSKVGKTPASVCASSEKKDKDVIVMQEGKKKFLRMIDGKNTHDFMPFLSLPTSLKDKKVEVKLQMRVRDDSNFYVEGRDKGYRGGFPSFKVYNGKIETPKGKIDLPKDKWLDVVFTFDMIDEKARGYTCKVSEANKVIADFKGKYTSTPLEKLGTIVISAVGEKGSFDLANISVKNCK